MTFGRNETFGMVHVDAAVTMLRDFRVNCFVRKINEKRFVVPAPDEVNGIPVENIGDVAAPIHVPSVFVNRRVDIGTLSLETNPTIETRSRRVVIPHVPLADESRYITRLAQQ